jgi:hypothetical protein
VSVKTFWLQFGTGDPREFGGLSPTLIAMYDQTGVTYVGPTITEIGVSSGLYKFAATTSQSLSIIFLADGGATLADADRYVTGVLDPIASVDMRLGFLGDSFGSTSVDPTTAIGYLKRLVEWLEGNAIFNKSTGIWTVSSRGSSTTLAAKTLTNTSSQAGKS